MSNYIKIFNVVVISLFSQLGFGQGGPDHLPGHIESGNPGSLLKARYNSGAVNDGKQYLFMIEGIEYAFDRYFFISSKDRINGGYHKEIFRIIKKPLEVGKKVYYEAKLIETDNHQIVIDGYNWHVETDPLNRKNIKSGIIKEIQSNLIRLYFDGKWEDFYRVTLESGTIVYFEKFLKKPEKEPLVYVSNPFTIVVKDNEFNLNRRGILYVDNISKIERGHNH